MGGLLAGVPGRVRIEGHKPGQTQFFYTRGTQRRPPSHPILGLGCLSVARGDWNYKREGSWRDGKPLAQQQCSWEERQAPPNTHTHTTNPAVHNSGCAVVVGSSWYPPLWAPSQSGWCLYKSGKAWVKA